MNVVALSAIESNNFKMFKYIVGKLTTYDEILNHAIRYNRVDFINFMIEQGIIDMTKLLRLILLSNQEDLFYYFRQLSLYESCKSKLHRNSNLCIVYSQ